MLDKVKNPEKGEGWEDKPKPRRLKWKIAPEQAGASHDMKRDGKPVKAGTN